MDEHWLIAKLKGLNFKFKVFKNLNIKYSWCRKCGKFDDLHIEALQLKMFNKQKHLTIISKWKRLKLPSLNIENSTISKSHWYSIFVNGSIQNNPTSK